MMGTFRYYDRWIVRWFERMAQAGWRYWLFVDREHIWRHADEPVYLTPAEAHDLFHQFVNTGGNYIPTPYDIAEAADG